MITLRKKSVTAATNVADNCHLNIQANISVYLNSLQTTEAQITLKTNNNQETFLNSPKENFVVVQLR